MSDKNTSLLELRLDDGLVEFLCVQLQKQGCDTLASKQVQPVPHFLGETPLGENWECDNGSFHRIGNTCHFIAVGSGVTAMLFSSSLTCLEGHWRLAENAETLQLKISQNSSFLDRFTLAPQEVSTLCFRRWDSVYLVAWPSLYRIS